MNVECIRGQWKTNTDCSYQRFQRGLSLRLSLRSSGERGIGLFTDQYIEKDAFIIEYMGEVIQRGEFYRRCSRYYYGVQPTDSEVIDASRQGSLVRFANHSCAPNSRLERWDINGEVCCGLFAIADIECDAELTFS
ncbi:hypothetical protein PHYSODRAFT_509638 [Phytophthora sojae]|uniref:SET domain-containing protein n=1 Tax=Phytophthora sojae (strain P6497) TaxID=1094619 RepID=G4ZM02_PHYSP|nr:hypothetical protein PHYSODRAFT_509638 [Phytophthora sojae]EGZ15631.1 hypothetical protein PHYSODRAFT_509638 [Phytophthora sojae]|eukprot:XP_009529380.1 hypothetical protein PHYSODRAFT_509638 [Phytophthora sojae]